MAIMMMQKCNDLVFWLYFVAPSLKISFHIREHCIRKDWFPEKSSVSQDAHMDEEQLHLIEICEKN